MEHFQPAATTGLLLPMDQHVNSTEANKTTYLLLWIRAGLPCWIMPQGMAELRNRTQESWCPAPLHKTASLSHRPVAKGKNGAQGYLVPGALEMLQSLCARLNKQQFYIVMKNVLLLSNKFSAKKLYRGLQGPDRKVNTNKYRN
ncbi:unnamed protein product [Eretmochelys imbricata]